jgi:hypothetical protein
LRLLHDTAKGITPLVFGVAINRSASFRFGAVRSQMAYTRQPRPRPRLAGCTIASGSLPLIVKVSVFLPLRSRDAIRASNMVKHCVMSSFSFCAF